MSVSPAQFANWIRRRGAARVLLAEQRWGYESGGGSAVGTIYLSCGQYATKATDTPSSISYRDVIMAAGMRRRIDLGGRRTRVEIPQMVLAASDALIDFLADKIIDGFECKWYLGDASWDRADFRHVATGVAERANGSDEQYAISYRDKRLLLDREIRGDAVGGSGPDATKYLPLIWGSAYNLAPFLFDQASDTWAVLSNFSGSSVTAVDDVRDGGISLDSGALFTFSGAGGFSVDAGTNVFTKTAHSLALNDVVGWDIANNDVDLPKIWLDAFPGMSAQQYWVKSVPTPDTFTLSATRGGATLDITGTTYNNPFTTTRFRRTRYLDTTSVNGRIQLSQAPEARLTLDVLNLPADFDPAAPFALAAALALAYGNVGSASEIDAAAAAAADVALAAKVDTGYTTLVVRDRENLWDVLDRLVREHFGWCGDDGLGVLTFGVLDVSGLGSATPAHTISEGEIDDGVEWENLPVGASRVDVRYKRNLTPQADGLLDGVSSEDRTLYSQPYGAIQRSSSLAGSSYAANPANYHATMVEGAPIDLDTVESRRLGTAATISLEDYADEIVADQAPNLRPYRCQSGLDKYDWALGGVAGVTYPRHSLGDGRNALVLAHDIDFVGGTVGLELLAQVTPDVATASHA